LPQIAPDLGHRYEPFPLTDVQQTYWIGRCGMYDLSACGANVYMEFEFADESGLVLERFGLALERLIARHDILRLIILPDGRAQILQQVPQYPIEVVDLRGHGPELVAAELQKVQTRMRMSQAAIDRWPLFEFMAHKLDNERIRLHARLDALLIDGASRVALLKELPLLMLDPLAPRPALEFSYRDYALAWSAIEETTLYRRSRAYWLGRLESLPPAPELPLARDINPLTPSLFKNRTLTLLEPDAWTRLKTRAADAGLTPSGLVVSAFAEVLAYWSKSQQFTFSLVSALRPPIHAQMTEIIGNFNTVYLLAVDTSPDTFEDRARRVQRQILTDLQHRYFSGLRVLRELNRRRGGSPNASMPVLFNSVVEYSHPSYRRVDGGEAKAVAEADDPHGLEVMDGSVYLPQVLLIPTVSEEKDGSLLCKWQSAEEVFSAGLMQEMLKAYALLLKRLADNEESWREPLIRMGTPAQLEVDGQPTRERAATGLKPLQETGGFVAPRDALEQRLAKLWEDILHVAPIGIRDDFFSLGGDSLMVARLVVRIRQQFGHEFELSAIFQEATIEHLAHALRLQAGHSIFRDPDGAMPQRKD
jgi:pyochelin synthetase